MEIDIILIIFGSFSENGLPYLNHTPFKYSTSNYFNFWSPWTGYVYPCTNYKQAPSLLSREDLYYRYFTLCLAGIGALRVRFRALNERQSMLQVGVGVRFTDCCTCSRRGCCRSGENLQVAVAAAEDDAAAAAEAAVGRGRGRG